MVRQSLLILLPMIAAFALSQRRRLAAIIGMGLLSFMLAGVYLLSHAPDVAITEVAIGAALVTFIYVLAIRKTGRLVVASDEVPGLLSREGEALIGLEYAILTGFARHLGLDLAVHLLPSAEVKATLLRGEADIGAGGIVGTDDERFLSTPGHLPTALFRLSSGGDIRAQPSLKKRQEGYFSDVLEAVRTGKRRAYTLDLARFVALSRLDLSDYTVTRLEGEPSYTFLVAPDKEALHHQFVSYLDRLRESKELARLISRYFP